MYKKGTNELYDVRSLLAEPLVLIHYTLLYVKTQYLQNKTLFFPDKKYFRIITIN